MTSFFGMCNVKGYGCWENIFLSQTIEAEGKHLVKLKVDQISNEYQNDIIVGIIDAKFTENYLQYKFSYYRDKAAGQQISIFREGQIITVELDFSRKIDQGLLIVDSKYKLWFHKGDHIGALKTTDSQWHRGGRSRRVRDTAIHKSLFKFALAMGGSGLKLELVYFGDVL